MIKYVRHFVFYYDYDEDINILYGDIISQFIDLSYFMDSERLCLKTSQGTFYAENVDLALWVDIVKDFSLKNLSIYFDLTKYDLTFTRG